MFFADDSLTPDSFVMRAPLDVLRCSLGLREEAAKRIVSKTSAHNNGGMCQLCDNGSGRFPLRFSSLFVVKAVR